MALSENQIKLLQRIQDRLQRGDIKTISLKTGVSREHVGRALNTTTDFFNEPVVDAAMEIINTREENATKYLEQLSADTVSSD